MPYTIPTFEALRVKYLRDVKNLDPDAHIDGDSDNYIRGSATASAVHGLYHYQHWIARQILPSTADPENLEQHASNRGMFLKPPTKADGTVTLVATAEIVPAFASGLPCTHTLTDEATGETSTLGIVTTQAWEGGPPPEGGIVLSCAAALSGTFPTLENAAVTVQTAPTGVSSEAVATMYGGTNQETHTELLARLLFRMRNPPGGGNASDYVTWAMEVPGVTWAKCYPLRRGEGTVDVVLLTASGVPGPQLVAKVQAHVDAKRPVTCPDFLAFAPVASPVDIAAQAKLDSGYAGTLPDMRLAALAELESRYFAGLYPGDPFLMRRAQSVLINVSGMADAAITSPAANLAEHALTWYRLGDLTLEIFP